MNVAFVFLLAMAQDQTGGVSGTVTDAVARTPVKKTSVVMIAMTAQNQSPQMAMTDSTGTFALTGIAPGKYRMMFQNQTYPQARFGGISKTVEIKATETATVSVELTPGAVLSGHIADEDGDPLSGCNVELRLAKRPDQNAQYAGAAPTNEDGEYRVYSVMPGKYIVAASCRLPVFQERPFSSARDADASRAYPMQYYPAATEIKSAQAVELIAGSEKSGIDFQMVPATITQIHGVLSPGGADWHGAMQFNLQLFSEERSGMNFGTTPDVATGTFQFQRVFPGSYILASFSTGEGVGSFQRIEVGERPLQVAVTLHHAMDLSGKLEIEGNGKVTPKQVQVMLMAQYQLGMPTAQSQVNDDGTFTLKNVMPSLWRIRANAPGMFVKSAWLGSTDVTDAPMDLSGGAGGTLRVVLSTNMAAIHGSAPAGQMVYAERIGDLSRSRPSVQADKNGQYTFASLAPATYRLSVADPGNAPPDDGGQEVTVREGETLTVDLK